MRILKKLNVFSVSASRIFFILIIPALFCDGFHGTFAQDFIKISADTQLDYANHCFENQDYASSSAEYKKFIYLFPDDERVFVAEYKIGMSFFHDKSYSKALNQFTEILEQKGPADTGILSAFMISRCYQRTHNYQSAIENLFYLKQVTTDQHLADEIYYQLGWLYLESGEFIQARSTFSAISIANQAAYDTGNIKAELSMNARIQQKEPILAGIFSIIPGGGYLYCGRYRDALTAFLVNGVLIYGGYESFDEDLYAIGGMMAVIELGFYAGNIYGGVSSAHKFNLKKQNEFVQDMKKKFNPVFKPDLKPGLSMQIKSDDIMLGMTYHF